MSTHHPAPLHPGAARMIGFSGAIWDQLNPLSGIPQPRFWGLLGPLPCPSLRDPPLCRHGLMLSHSSTRSGLPVSSETDMTVRSL